MRAIFVLFGVMTFSSGAQALFDYDRNLPFDVQTEGLSPRTDVISKSGSLQPIPGRRMDFILIEPASAAKSKRPGIVFQHGGGQSMRTYIGDAILLTKAGAVCLILESPYRLTDEELKAGGKGAVQRDHAANIVISIRRAFDWLEARPDIDRSRLAYVGHSYGGNAGAILSAVDKRIRYFVLAVLVASLTRHIGENQSQFWKDYRASMTPQELGDVLALAHAVDPDQFLPRSAPSPMLFQCARFDMDDVKRDCEVAYSIAASPKTLQWYDVDHSFANIEASLDRLVWLGDRLALPDVRTVLRQQVAKSWK